MRPDPGFQGLSLCSSTAIVLPPLSSLLLTRGKLGRGGSGETSPDPGCLPARSPHRLSPPRHRGDVGYNTWEADHQAVVACLLEAFAAQHAHFKSSAAWIAGRARLKDTRIRKAIKDLLVYEGEEASKVQSAAKTALKQIPDAGKNGGPGHTPVRNRTTHPLAPVPEEYHYVGEVLHYWPRPRAALVDLAHPLTVGDELIILDRKAREGKPVERFRQVLESIQVEGRQLCEASSGMSVALALKEPVHVGERLYADRTNARP